MLQWAAAGTFVVYLISVWTGTMAAGVIGPNYWIVAGLLSAVGVSGYGIFLWFSQRKGAQAAASAAGVPAGEGGDAPSGSGDVPVLIREAEARLSASKSAPGSRVAGLPVVFLIGESGSAKSSTMAQSGLEPELLAGQTSQDGAMAPTAAVNVWLARQTLFVEAGGALYRDGAGWTTFVKKLAPGKMKAGGSSIQAPRAALVCVDTEGFTKPGAGEAMAQVARGLNARLGEIAQQFGISLPVYVLLTRTDRLPHFSEYVRTLTNEESAQVCGATLAMETESGGVYAERENRRLSEAFDQLYHSLCDKRIRFLPREHEADKLAPAYEFPREFRKLRGPLVQFLIDLGRPSQLRANPVLRGFYFSGVRPVYLTDSAVASAGPRAADPQHEPLAGATRMFRAGMQAEMARQAMAAPQITGTRKVPQWVFLSHLFNNVILADRDAMGLSGASFKTALGQRILWSALAAVCWILLLGFIVSFFGNRNLENEALAAAEALPRGQSGTELASVEQLRKLEAIRVPLDKLTAWERDGAPFRLRWFLYTGSDLYPELRCIYYQRLQQLMLNQTQATILASMQRLPPVPNPTDEYAPIYDSLKAHMILTGNRDKSTRAWLTPVLMSRWTAGREIDPEPAKLAQAQFDFLGDDIRANPPCYSAAADTSTIDRTRRYLSGFSGLESVYRFMIADASRRNPPVNYNKEFAGSDVVILNNRDVEGAFTKAGWTFMQGALKKAADYFGGEEWVLGPYKPAAMDRTKLEKDLSDKYNADFIRAWRQYLKNTTFKGYTNLQDAAQKLENLSSNTTPLLAVFWLASNRACVGDPKIAEGLQPIHAVAPCPAAAMQFIQPVTTSYIQALNAMQGAADKAAQTPGDAAAANQIRPVAESARQQTRQIAQGFQLDEAKTHEVAKRILDDPITSLDALVRGMGPDQMNAAGRQLCKQFDEMTRKFPFSSEAQAEATLQDVGALLKPKEGAVWAFYDQRLKQHLKREGANFIPNPEAPFPLNANFVNWFTQVVRFGEALYPAGAAEPKMNYTLQPQPSAQLLGMRVTVDGQTFNYTGTTRGSAAPFFWPGAGRREARIEAMLVGGSSAGLFEREGLWAVFHFFAEADAFVPAGANYIFEWRPVSGRQKEPMRVGGTPLVYRFVLDTKGAPPVFHKSYLSSLKCVSPAAR